jgi:hypothetical protein
LQLGAGVVPLFAVFAAAAEICGSVEMKPCSSRARRSGLQARPFHGYPAWKLGHLWRSRRPETLKVYGDSRRGHGAGRPPSGDGVIHGTKVADPYRWLEDDNSAETARWVEAENKVTFGYLEKIPYRAQVKARLEQLFNYPKYTAPFRKGDYLFYTKNVEKIRQEIAGIRKGECRSWRIIYLSGTKSRLPANTQGRSGRRLPRVADQAKSVC